ncbi:hypothetical protein GCM10009821_22720 [Aeromicrobium halocynthiae]|uniref:Alkylmercury lyase n=1 Tax=Aeromicrobium halocynthiae TaxID=560557 RepID=A0ABN2W306_9ACTN
MPARVTLRGDGVCPDLQRAARVVATARELGEVVDYTVTADAELGTTPSVTVEPAEPVEDVFPLTDVASQERLDLTIR